MRYQCSNFCALVRPVERSGPVQAVVGQPSLAGNYQSRAAFGGLMLCQPRRLVAF